MVGRANVVVYFMAACMCTQMMQVSWRGGGGRGTCVRRRVENIQPASVRAPMFIWPLASAQHQQQLVTRH